MLVVSLWAAAGDGEIALLFMMIQALPVLFFAWAAWRIWRLGGRKPREKVTVPRPRWLVEFCRHCGYGTPVHEKTHLCQTCHTRPLPEKAEIPDLLPDRF